jgi:hypothetical protein
MEKRLQDLAVVLALVLVLAIEIADAWGFVGK